MGVIIQAVAAFAVLARRGCTTIAGGRPTTPIMNSSNGVPGMAVRAPQPMNAVWLRKAFPLVRRIDVEVGVSQQIWDLSGMQGAGEWVLLDFPGLGAAESGVRDAFLCKRELREVQTILLLLDGRRPGGEGGQVIFNMMSADRPAGQDLRDSILVVMNRFDQLPIQADGGEAILERLIGWIRRDCLHHFVIFNGRHLKRILSSYFTYYHASSPRRDRSLPR